MLMAEAFKTGQAWALKNLFRVFWQLGCADAASTFFEYGSKRVDKVGLSPLIKVKALLQRHFDNVLTWFRHAITNAVSEGLNSKIQIVKASARGFRRFESYRNRSLFYCGKLDMALEARRMLTRRFPRYSAMKLIFQYPDKPYRSLFMSRSERFAQSGGS